MCNCFGRTRCCRRAWIVEHFTLNIRTAPLAWWSLQNVGVFFENRRVSIVPFEHFLGRLCARVSDLIDIHVGLRCSLNSRIVGIFAAEHVVFLRFGPLTLPGNIRSHAKRSFSWVTVAYTAFLAITLINLWLPGRVPINSDDGFLTFGRSGF